MNDDYQRIAGAIRFIRERADAQPSLEEVAEQLQLSPYHFQRLFKRWAGVSPKRFLQHLTAQHARNLLRQSRTVLETSFEVGLSGPGRLHDLLIAVEAATPGEIRSGGAELEIRYGLHPTPFGDCLLAITTRGICRLEFVDGNGDAALGRLQAAWPEACIARDQPATGIYIRQIFGPAAGPGQLTLLLRGTNFQLQVWQALLRIPEGAVTSYGDLAARLGAPGSSRAVGTAIGRNPIGYLIPCHRVLRGDGGLGGYRWGTERKLAILGRELTGTL